ncbi:MAG TPA: NAD(+) diphosphatase [Burkholderiales bacterium]|nr:NAD(+) diphosphatase [Burkholderiales bacterium]
MITLPFHSPEAFEYLVASPAPNEAGLWFAFSGDRLLVEIGPPSAAPSEDLRVPSRPQWARLPFGASAGLDAAALRTLYLGRLGQAQCYAAEFPADTPAPSGMSWENLRTLFSVLDDAHFGIAGRALQLVDWDRTHQFCGRCGTPTVAKADERVRSCPACRLSAYPRVAPAIMALICRGREVLLGRGPHFPRGMYSALAGFAGPGESLEQCLVREVAEEVNVSVGNIRYFASQPWPFPHSLMIAFVCDWTGGEIRPDPAEIEDAAWFDVFQLPKLPSRISIARALIDTVTGEMRRAHGSGG